MHPIRTEDGVIMAYCAGRCTCGLLGTGKRGKARLVKLWRDIDERIRSDRERLVNHGED